MTKVLLLFSSSDLGGAERSLTRMAAVPDEKVSYHLATFDGEGPWSRWAHELDLHPIVFGKRRGGQPGGKIRFGALRRLVGHVRRERYDIIYVVGLRASVAVRMVRPFLRGARLVHAVRWNPNSKSRLDRAFRLVEGMFSWLIDTYICNSAVSGVTLNSQIGVDQNKIAVIYNGLNEIPAARLKAASDCRDIVSIANLSPRKGFVQYLENVVLHIAKRHSNFRFIIAGRDEMNGQVQEVIARLGLNERVSWAGFVPDVSPILEQARIFVLPSLWNEGCPTAILEAMAYQVPVVAFNMDGIPELVESGTDGKLAPLGDYTGMRTAIEELIVNDTEVERLGNSGCNKVAERFLIHHCANRHGEVFESLAGSERNHGR